MSIKRGRYIHSRNSCRQIPDLLQMIFMSELLCPSKCIWIVSPWISNIQSIDNSANQFITLEPNWARRKIRFAEVLAKILSQGATVHVATRDDEMNQHFINTLLNLAPEQNPPYIQTAAKLHEKGILGDCYYLNGSMNFTFYGISINQEAIYYDTNPEVVAENRMIMANRWGAERC